MTAVVSRRSLFGGKGGIPVACAVGATVAVKDLFAALPVRRQVLMSCAAVGRTKHVQQTDITSMHTGRAQQSGHLSLTSPMWDCQKTLV